MTGEKTEDAKYDTAMARKVLEDEERKRQAAFKEMLEALLEEYKAQLVPVIVLSANGVVQSSVSIVFG